MKKQYAAVLMAAVMAAAGSMTSMAAGWQWLDGNGDGVAECYYFDGNGYMLSSTITPDGYQVNANGAWVSNGTVQTQSQNQAQTQAADSTYDSQYPLAGMLDQLGLNFANNGTADVLYWSGAYQNWVNGYDNGPVIIWNKVKETNNLNYYTIPSGYDEMLAIAKLAGVSINLPYADEAKAEALANNLRDFFKNFPNWKTASDYEKACHIARWIEQAEYDSTATDNGNEYGCLINKKASCSGYTIAARLLAHCVGLQVISGDSEAQNHTYPVFNINGVWLSYDATPTGNETVFRIHDVYEYVNYPIHQNSDFSVDFCGNTYKYFKDRGYVVPTSLRDKFDSSLVSTETDYKGTRDILRLQ